MSAPDPASPATDERPGPLAFGPFVLDPAQARLTRDGQPVPLNGRPLQVLALLAAHPGRLLDKNAVLDAVWGHRHVTESVLKGAVNTLRAALGDDAKAPRYVETVPRRGYRFVGTLAPALTDATPAAAGALVGNLPDPGTAALVGRRRELAQLTVLLRGHRLVTLTGLGGVGKTRLALAVAGVEAPPDGAWLVRLDAIEDPALLVPTVAQALRLGGGAAAGSAALGRALAGQRLRLVLDNAEHLIDAVAALVQALLQAAPELQVLVTSQRALRLAAEQVLPLPPLALPAEIADAAPPPEGYDAAQLLCERVRQHQPGWSPAPADHAGIAAICRALDGVPLALELAAARVPLLGIDGVRQRLDQRFALLTRGPRDAAERHRSLAAALDWTCSLLSPDEQQALQRLAVFAGGFDAGAAEAVLGGPEAAPALDLVDALRELSLITAEPAAHGLPRLRLFDSVRRHALDRLAAAGLEADARRRHLAWVAARFRRAEEEEFFTPLLTWLPPLRAEVDNLRSALGHGLRADAEPALRELALHALAGSAMFWVRSGQRGEGWKWMQAAQVLPADGPVGTWRDHAYGVFVAYAQLGAPADGLAALRRSRDALRAAGDARRLYLSLYAERQLLYRLAPGEGDGLAGEMRACLQPGWGALQQRHLALLEALRLRDAGDIDGHIACLREAAVACRAAGGIAEAWPLANALAQAQVMQGHWAQAAQALDGALAEVRAAGLLREQTPLLAVAATVHLRLDAAAPTLALARQAQQLLQAEGLGWWMADALPWAAWHAGRTDDALRLRAWADGLVRQRGDTRGPLFSRLRADFDEAVAARAGAAALQAGGAAGPGLDERSAAALAFGAPG